jgi:hypothetical protein
VKYGTKKTNRETKEKSRVVSSDYDEIIESGAESEKEVDSDGEGNDADDAFYGPEYAESSENVEGVEEQKSEQGGIEDFTLDNFS